MYDLYFNFYFFINMMFHSDECAIELRTETTCFDFFFLSAEIKPAFVSDMQVSRRRKHKYNTKTKKNKIKKALTPGQHQKCASWWAFPSTPSQKKKKKTVLLYVSVSLCSVSFFGKNSIL